MYFIRFLAVFVYLLAAMLGLKYFANLASGQATVEGDWWLTFVLLIVCILVGISAWLVDRYYCRATAKD